MRKLALPEEILLSIQQPARYIGGEVNMVKKGRFRETRGYIVIYAQINVNDIQIKLCIVQKKTDNPTQINAVVMPV